MIRISFIIIVLSSVLYSQITLNDRSAVLEIRNTNPIEPGITEFDIYITRNTDLWTRFANATYYFDFKKDFEEQEDYIISPDKVRFEYFRDSSDLFLTPTEIDIEGLREYQITTYVLDGALVVSIIGPETFDDAQEVPLNISGEEDLRLGTFRASSINQREAIPNKIGWKEPYIYWQVTAYKNDVPRDYRKIPESEFTDPNEFLLLKLYERDDNIDLKKPDIEITYVDDEREPKGLIPRYVDAKYFGDGRIRVTWKTDGEIFAHNFVIKRMIKNFYTPLEEFASLQQFFRTDSAEQYYAIPPITTGPNSQARYTNQYKVVATGTTYDRLNEFDIFWWDGNGPNDQPYNREDILSEELQQLITGAGPETPYPDLVVGFGSARDGRGDDYSWIDPTVLEKGEWGCYHVSFQDWNGNVTPLGYDCEQIPNSVIAFANAYPNPFEVETQVDFELLDDVQNLNMRIVDGVGKVVAYAVGLDGKEIRNVSAPNSDGGNISNYALRGTHTVKVNMPKTSLGQGTYTLIITCDPLNDRFVGSSSAVVKLQVTR